MRPKRMKALVKAQAGPGLALRDVPVPTPGAGEVLIRIRKTAICGTDVHIYTWDEWSRQTIGPRLRSATNMGVIGSGRACAVCRWACWAREGPYRVRPVPQLPGRATPPVPQYRGRGRQQGRRVRPVSVYPGYQRMGLPGVPEELTMFEYRQRTRRCRSTCWARIF